MTAVAERKLMRIEWMMSGVLGRLMILRLFRMQ